MYDNVITQISEQCYKTAKKRGKNTTTVGCVIALGDELSEYWKAVDSDNITDVSDISVVHEIKDDTEFVNYYKAHIHNTSIDELADVIITAATWYEEAKRLSSGKPVERSTDALMAMGAVAFISYLPKNVIVATGTLIPLKMKYNELRPD